MVHVDYQVKDENIEKYFAGIRKVRDNLINLRDDTFQILVQAILEGTARWTKCEEKYDRAGLTLCNLPKGHERVGINHANILPTSKTGFGGVTWSHRGV